MIRRSFSAVSALLFLVACSSDSGPTTPPAPVVTTVVVTAGSTTLNLGQTTQLSATVLDADGEPMSVGVTWASSNTGVATVSSSGVVTAAGVGTATLSATANGVSGSVAITVELIPAASVAVTPGTGSFLTADAVQLGAVVRDATGAEIGGHTITWSVDNPAVATVDASGVLTAQSEGDVVVTASTSGQTGSATFEIDVGAGPRVAALEVFDDEIPDLMDEFDIAGASFGVMKDGRLVGYRSYGYADVDLMQETEPSSLFRYASLSKGITGTAIMALVDDGLLSLDDKVFTILDHLAPLPGETADPRLADITVRQALSHSHGWRFTVNEDPLWRGRAVSDAFGGPYPATQEMYARFWMGLPLNFDPGNGFSYGQIGYVLAQLVIEEVTGLDYESYLRDNVLAPLVAAQQTGRTERAGRLPGEVTYYYPGTAQNNMAATGDAPFSYGWNDIEGSAAAAGWVGTAVDYLRVVGGIDGDATRPDLFSEALVQQLYAPAFELNPNLVYGLGFYSEGGWPNPLVSHSGATIGTANTTRRYENGVTVVILTNASPTQEISVFNGAWWGGLRTTLDDAVAAVTEWPAHDLFGQF